MSAKRATAQATIQEIATKSTGKLIAGHEGQNKANELTVTFGSLTFPINQEQASDHLQARTSHEAQDNLLRVLHVTKYVQVHHTVTRTSTHIQPAIKPSRINHTPLTPHQTSATQKFIKVPPATENWQKAVSKMKSKIGTTGTKAYKQCNYCHKEGHIQNFCWYKINCYTCGKKGHKSAKCFYKTSLNPLSLKTKTIEKKPKKKTKYQATPYHMEFVHSKPSLRDIYSPHRQTLNNENEYLCTVGLVVFIRGSPTPDFPRLMAAKMAEEHGGRPRDYDVSPASITPYIVTCPSIQIRDTIVQRGTYSIPQSQIQFRVHEWRPRFGMAYDPSTHQIWVRLVGLPLQAWTILEIHAFVQNFGHPLQILPFGTAAEHYKDITVLVAAKHPSRIPLAYIYREGEYSTQVDVLILAFRPWEDSYFHPPHDQQPQSGPHNQLQQPDDHTVSANRSSSSSSNNAPSEPTIDYSSWSPRSYALQPIRKQKWKMKLTMPPLELNATPSESSLDPPLLQLTHTLYVDGQLYLQTSVQKPRILLATENPTYPHNPRGITSISPTSPLYSYPLYSLNPIFINLLFSPVSTGHHNSTMGAAQKNPITSLLHAALSPQDVQTMSLALGEGYKSLARMIEEAYIKRILGPLEGPKKLKTKTDYIPLQAPQLTSALLSKALSGNPRTAALSQLFVSSAFLQASDGNLQDVVSAHLSSPNPIDSTYSNQLVPHTNGNKDLKHLDITKDFPMVTDDGPNSKSASSSPRAGAPLKRDKKKRSGLPMRRSPRLQAKHQLGLPQLKNLPKNKSVIAKVPFDIDNAVTSLDAEKALQILQATGLQINKHIQQLIDDAIKLDHLNAGSDQHMPSTPLHDEIPP